MDVRKGKRNNPFPVTTQTTKILLLGLLLICCIFLLTHFKLSNYFPIKHVHIYGVNHVDQQEVQNLLLPLVTKGFFGTNVERIRDRLRQLPWVLTTAVRRSWPDKIEITIIEKDAIARWNDSMLLSSTGEIFQPKLETYPADIPSLSGPDGKHMVMLDYFNKINRLLSPLHAKISHLELTPYLTWTLQLNNGITMQMGHKDILTRLDHFVKVYPKIVGNKSTDVDYIDLRYVNGVAIRWRTHIKT